MSLRHCHARRAFTLVEVLAAILMLGIVLPVAMYGISLATTTAGVARHRTQATTLAKAKLDEILMTTPLQTGSGDFGDRWKEYTWSAELATWDTPAVQGLSSTIQELKVSVSWTQRGQQRSVALSTLVYQSAATTGATGGTTP